MTEEFNEKGSFYMLVKKEWKRVGIGRIIVNSQPLDANHVTIIIKDKKSQKQYSYQCMTRTKDKEPRVVLIRGPLSGKSLRVYCVRFKSEEIALKFKNTLERISKTDQVELQKLSKKFDLLISGFYTNYEDAQLCTDLNPWDDIHIAHSKTWNCAICDNDNVLSTLQCANCKLFREDVDIRYKASQRIERDSFMNVDIMQIIQAFCGRVGFVIINVYNALSQKQMWLSPPLLPPNMPKIAPIPMNQLKNENPPETEYQSRCKGFGDYQYCSHFAVYDLNGDWYGPVIGVEWHLNKVSV